MTVTTGLAYTLKALVPAHVHGLANHSSLLARLARFLLRLGEVTEVRVRSFEGRELEHGWHGV